MSESSVNNTTQSTDPNAQVDFSMSENDNPIVKPTETGHEDVGNAADGNPEKKEHTRSKLAILFVLGFFAILFLCFVYAIMVQSSLSELKDTLVGVVGSLSGILGFIVGYYYKSSQEQ